MFDKSKLIILVTGTNNAPFDKNWKECEKTWIPLVRELGYNVKIAIGNPDLKNYFKIDSDIIYFKADDGKDGLVDKSIKLPIKWILEETDFEYYFRIDSDTFVHPQRFDDLLVDNFKTYKDIDYMGCSIPVDLWWDKPAARYFIQQTGVYASGVAYFISKKAMIIAKNDIKVIEDKELQWDDYVLGRAMWENNIPLLHDGRILLHSKYNKAWENKNIDLPEIDNLKSIVAIQHYMNGYMQQSMINLGFKI